MAMAVIKNEAIDKVRKGMVIWYGRATSHTNNIITSAFFHSTSLLQRAGGGSGSHSPRRSGFAKLLRSSQYDTAEWFTKDNQQRHHVISRKGIRISQEDIERMFRSEFSETTNNNNKTSIKEQRMQGTLATFRSYNNHKRTSGTDNSNKRYNSSNTSNNQKKKDQHESSKRSDTSMSDCLSDRMTLGLSSCGPLQVEDVKNAYRACALKWHPDRHQESSKEVAAEKFKRCSSAYQSLCKMLGVPA